MYFYNFHANRYSSVDHVKPKESAPVPVLADEKEEQPTAQQVALGYMTPPGPKPERVYRKRADPTQPLLLTRSAQHALERQIKAQNARLRALRTTGRPSRSTDEFDAYVRWGGTLVVYRDADTQADFRAYRMPDGRVLAPDGDFKPWLHPNHPFKEVGLPPFRIAGTGRVPRSGSGSGIKSHRRPNRRRRAFEAPDLKRLILNRPQSAAAPSLSGTSAHAVESDARSEPPRAPRPPSWKVADRPFKPSRDAPPVPLIPVKMLALLPAAPSRAADSAPAVFVVSGSEPSGTTASGENGESIVPQLITPTAELPQRLIDYLDLNATGDAYREHLRLLKDQERAAAAERRAAQADAAAAASGPSALALPLVEPVPVLLPHHLYEAEHEMPLRLACITPSASELPVPRSFPNTRAPSVIAVLEWEEELNSSQHPTDDAEIDDHDAFGAKNADAIETMLSGADTWMAEIMQEYTQLQAMYGLDYANRVYDLRLDAYDVKWSMGRGLNVPLLPPLPSEVQAHPSDAMQYSLYSSGMPPGTPSSAAFLKQHPELESLFSPLSPLEPLMSPTRRRHGFNDDDDDASSQVSSSSRSIGGGSNKSKSKSTKSSKSAKSSTKSAKSHTLQIAKGLRALRRLLSEAAQPGATVGRDLQRVAQSAVVQFMPPPPGAPAVPTRRLPSSPPPVPTVYFPPRTDSAPSSPPDTRRALPKTRMRSRSSTRSGGSRPPPLVPFAAMPFGPVGPGRFHGGHEMPIRSRTLSSVSPRSDSMMSMGATAAAAAPTSPPSWLQHQHPVLPFEERGYEQAEVVALIHSINEILRSEGWDDDGASALESMVSAPPGRSFLEE
ncbi:hypothetical protein BC828DRAFT_404580 [Blastocladiella britannica]|nr:hypothetical protein BC828DRAFT_404580 [Blastocladiella britannica]